MVELLRIMRQWCAENFESQGCAGLCVASTDARMDKTITPLEMSVFDAYVGRNRPIRPRNTYGWPPRELQPRLDWLDAEIERLEKEQQDTAEK